MSQTSPASPLEATSRLRLMGLGSAVLGSALVMGTLTAMNMMESRDKQEGEQTVSSFEVKRRPPPPAAKPKPKPRKRKQSRKTAAPLPNLGAALSGVDFGLPGLGDALADATDSLLGDVQDVVMTEDAVDEVPRPVQRAAAPYPPRARAKGIEGFVSVSMLIDQSGGVKDLQILEAQPPGVFDDVALAALRGWRFQPAMYEGRAVAVRVRQTLRFALE